MCKATCGWTLGEEILYNGALSCRLEKAISVKESCVIGISNDKLSEFQHYLLKTNN